MTNSQCSMSLAMCPEPGYWKLELRPRQQIFQPQDYVNYSYPRDGRGSAKSLTRLIAKSSVKIKPWLRNISSYKQEVSTVISQLGRGQSRLRNLDHADEHEFPYEPTSLRSRVVGCEGYAFPYYGETRTDTQSPLYIANRNSRALSAVDISRPHSPCTSTHSLETGICDLTDDSTTISEDLAPTYDDKPIKLSSCPQIPQIALNNEGPIRLQQQPIELQQGSALDRDPPHVALGLIIGPRFPAQSYIDARRDRSRSMFLSPSKQSLPDVLKAGKRSV